MNTYLNLGCGSRYHKDWTNIDIVPYSSEVIQHDISSGIPLPTASCAVVYHAALIEHLRYDNVPPFLAECHRVLKPGGIIRVGVPDLEKTCQLYLAKLTAALNGNETAAHDYNWLLLELYDQAVREKSGGRMHDYLCKNPLPNEAFIYQRTGVEGRQLVNALQRKNAQNKGKHSKLFQRNPSELFNKIFTKVKSLPSETRKWIVGLILTREERRAIKIGCFRLSGEVHQWAYDRYSLSILLLSTGFYSPNVRDANTSQIPNWTNFHLDVSPDGEVLKPDLFFMEAIK